jgi:hypothetical protein
VNRTSSTAALCLALVACTAPGASPSPTAQIGTQIAGEAPTPAPRVSPGPTATATTAPSLNEAQVWSRIRAALPGVPAPVPTWLPPSIDRSKVDLRMLVADPSDPRYEVVYSGAGGAQLAIALGPFPREVESGWSGVGTRVRGVGAALTFSGALWTDRTAIAPRVVRWEEGRHVLRIESNRFTGDDLLHVAWYLDQSGKPAPANPYTRNKVGSCAKQDAAPEDTVLVLLTLTGRGDRDAVLDCFAMDMIGESGPSSVANWAGLPTVSSVRIHSAEEIAGRVQLAVSWAFAADPGGAWGPSATRFFELGPEDGRWRIHALGSMGMGHNP